MIEFELRTFELSTIDYRLGSGKREVAKMDKKQAQNSQKNQSTEKHRFRHAVARGCVRINPKCRIEKHRFSLRTKAKKHVRKSANSYKTTGRSIFGVNSGGHISMLVPCRNTESGGPKGPQLQVKVEISAPLPEPTHN